MGTGVSICLFFYGALLTFAFDFQIVGVALDSLGIVLMLLGVTGVVATRPWSIRHQPRRTL